MINKFYFLKNVVTIDFVFNNIGYKLNIFTFDLGRSTRVSILSKIKYNKTHLGADLPNMLIGVFLFMIKINMEGWIKLHRQILDNPLIMKDSDYFAVWIYLLMKATHSDYDVFFQKQRITLKPGQFTIGRKQISNDLKINESKIQRILKLFENEQQIEQQTSTQCRLLTIKNWQNYQDVNNKMNNKGTTNEQQVNTKQEYNNKINKKNITKVIGKKEIITTKVVTLKELIKKEFTEEFIKSVYDKYKIPREDFKEECEMFVKKWTEKSTNGIKERWEKEKTFDVKLRFYTWMRNYKKWNKTKDIKTMKEF